MLNRVLVLAVCVTVWAHFESSSYAAEIDQAATKAAIEKTVEKYQQAFRQSDAKALTALFAPEAEYVYSSGLTIHGRKEIEAALTGVLSRESEGELKIEIQSIRPVADGVAVEEGTTSFVTKSGQTLNSVKYFAVHVRQPDQSWLIAYIQEVGASEPTVAGRLQELAWLEGGWREEDGATSITTEWKRSEDGNFLISEFSARGPAGLELKGTQRIGWDAKHKTFRSWAFESTGGFAEGLWTRNQDGTWSVELTGTDASGAPVATKLTYGHDGADGLVISRERLSPLGEGIQSSTHRVVRQPPAPASKKAQ
ncbi:YybH family protein [Planctomicrobium sp. SH527]|uniref:YybH family protein n=1 Tax=Planctomicrobium sp. SH527 TaxID=3448123 RepID=UPI003F5B62C0